MTLIEKAEKYADSRWDKKDEDNVETFGNSSLWCLEHNAYVDGYKEAINSIGWNKIIEKMKNYEANVNFYSSREQINEEFLVNWVKGEIEKQLGN